MMSTPRTTRSKGSTDLVPMEVHPEKKIAPARVIKAATVPKAKVVKSGTAVSSKAKSTAAAPPPTPPVVPPVGTEAYWLYMREQYRAGQLKRRIAKKKKLENEDIILAKDIEDSEDERKPKKAKKTKAKTKQERNEEAVAAAQSTGLDLYFTKGPTSTKGTKKRDKTCYFFKLPREVRDMIYGYVFAQSHSYSPVDMIKSYSDRLCWKLPGIFTACSATYDESSLVWLSKSTVSLNLKDSKFRNMLDRVKSENRGLRTNKATEDCKDFMESLTQFSCINIKLSCRYGMPKSSQAVPLAVALDFFSKLDYSEGKRIAVDLTKLYATHVNEAREVANCVREWMDKFPALHLHMGPLTHAQHYTYYYGGASGQIAKKLYEDLEAKYEDRVTAEGVQ